MKVSTKSSNNEGNWGMGFLLVFFHADHGDPPFKQRRRPSFSTKNNHANVPLLSKTQTTLSICALLVLTTFLLFTVTTFDDTSTVNNNNNNRINRRVLMQNPRNAPNVVFFGKGGGGNFTRVVGPGLHGMGSLYRRGSKGMTDLVVGHVAEGATEREVVSFLRLVHFSGLLSRSDLVLVFDSVDSVRRLGPVVKEESESFLRLVDLYGAVNVSVRGSGFGLTRYLRPVGEDDKEALWGKGGNLSRSGELTRASYGSVVGFDSSELDPEDSLSGFLDSKPMGIRRWACYPMLLGRLRRQFKHTMLVDVRSTLVLSDPFSAVRNRSAESVLVRSNSLTESTRHGRKNSGVGSHPNPTVIIGGSRGIRRLANAALTEIVRSVVEHKGKARNSVTESGIVNQLVHSGHLLKNINLINSDEIIPDASSLTGFNSVDSTNPGLLAFKDYFTVVQRGRVSSSNISVSVSDIDIDIDSIIMREICSSHELYSMVYRDCLASQ